jgi:hypothetical protein
MAAGLYISIGKSSFVTYEDEIYNDGVAGESLLRGRINVTSIEIGDFYGIVESIADVSSADFYIPNPE